MKGVLYKFGPIRDEFFENRLIRITQRDALNDPYEFYPVVEDLNRMRSAIPPKSVGNFNISDNSLIANHLNCMGVMSFTESKDNFLMWSHYGNEHKGIAIEYDANHEFFKLAQPVVYTEKRDRRAAIKETQGELNFNNDVFFKKSVHWEYEKEWRIADSLITSDCLIKEKNENGITEKICEWYPKRVDLFPWEKPGLYMKQVPPEALLSVTFGCRVSDDEIERVSKLIDKYPELNHVRKYRIRLCIDEYRLVFEEIENF